MPDQKLTRRAVLAALGGATGVASGLGSGGDQSKLTGGTMALQEAFNVAGNLWIGPDSARTTVDAESGRVYIGASGEGYTFYNGDGGTWVKKGLGDDANPISSVTSDSVNTEDTRTETLAYDHSEQYPQFPSQPVQSGPILLEPHPAVDNPVLTKDDVTDMAVDMVADPFVVVENGVYHMFFEALQRGGDSGIGHATSTDGLDWNYDQIVVGPRSTAVLNYPYVLKVDGTWYMFDFRDGYQMDLLEADSFPTNWSVLYSDILGVNRNEDPTLIPWNGTWYLFTHNATKSPEEKYLYYADSFPTDSWTEHPGSPVEVSDTLARNAGRPIVSDDHIDLPCRQNPGAVRQLRITELTKDSYSAYETDASPLLQGSGAVAAWNKDAMHHVDVVPSNGEGAPIAIVDGNANQSPDWQIGVYSVESARPRQAFDDWFAAGGAIEFSTIFGGIDGWYSNITGSAVENNSLGDRILWHTGTTSGSRIEKKIGVGNGSGMLNRASWRNKRTTAFGFRFNEDVTDRIDYYGTGDISNGGEGVALKVENGSIYGAVSDGSSESTSLLYDSPTITQRYGAVIRLFPSEGTVRFGLDRALDEERHYTTVSSNVPTGGGGDSKWLAEISIENTSGVKRQTEMTQFKTIQHSGYPRESY